MKWIYRIFTLLILAVALGLPFFIDNKEGKPMLSLPTTEDLAPSQLTPAATRTVYKWQDENGQWHYGDAPPTTAGAKFDRLDVRTDTNLIAGLKTESEETPSEQNPTTPETPTMTDPNVDMLSMERLKNVMNDAKAAKALMEQRNEQLKQITGDR